MPAKKRFPELPPKNPIHYRAPGPGERWIRSYHCKAVFGYSYSTALRNVKRGILPQPHQISPGIVAWDSRELADRNVAA